jgi:hypothetical protein
MRSRLLRLIMVLSIAVLLAAPARAQTAVEAILAIGYNGDLWQWTAEDGIEQLTTWGYNNNFARSHDGRFVAYTSQPQFVVDALVANVVPMIYVEPNNIWIYDLLGTVDDAVRIAVQPDNAAYTADTVIGIRRSAPQWSPDDTRLVWTELIIADFTYRMIVHDVATGQQTIIADDLPSPYADAGYFGEVEVFWASDTQLVTSTAGVYQDQLGEAYRLYDLDTNMFYEVGAPENSYASVLFPFGGNVVAAYDDGLVSFNMLNGRREVLTDYVFGVRSSVSDDGYTYLADWSGEATVWYVLGPDNTLNEAFTQPTYSRDDSHIAIAMDGTVAYVSDALYIWGWNGTIEVPNTGPLTEENEEFPLKLMWGPVDWLAVSPNAG